MDEATDVLTSSNPSVVEKTDKDVGSTDNLSVKNSMSLDKHGIITDLNEGGRMNLAFILPTCPAPLCVESSYRRAWGPVQTWLTT
jgi:hypothetical protein